MPRSCDGGSQVGGHTDRCICLQVGVTVAGNRLLYHWWCGGRVGWAGERKQARLPEQTIWPYLLANDNSTPQGGVEWQRLGVKVF
jgi:hypothetical protein